MICFGEFCNFVKVGLFEEVSVEKVHFEHEDEELVHFCQQNASLKGNFYYLFYYSKVNYKMNQKESIKKYVISSLNKIDH